jgi:uroporphyrinogen-III decarboxylase
MTKTTSRERALCALNHRQPDRIPVDFGATTVSGIHASCVVALRDYFGLEKKPVKAIDPGQFLGEIEADLKAAMGIDTEGIMRRTTRYGFPAEDWKPFRMYDGTEVLVPGRFNVTIDERGDTLMHPLGDVSNPPSARMPNGGYFFDPIIRQQPFDEEHLNPADNLEEYGPLDEVELASLEREARRAASTGRLVVANFGGTGFGDIAHIPGAGLPHPKGIRDMTEWYVSTRARRDYVHAVFAGQCAIALANLERIAARSGDLVDVVNICGTDFGTQTSSFCSVATFRELWLPYYREVNNWIHKNTRWKTFKHSCGAVEKFIPSFLHAGFDILNPVQCSATGMEAEALKQKYGRDLVFWGGGVDTQHVLSFGTPDEVREQVLQRCEAFYKGGGYVFNAIHNVQAKTPVENIVAMVRAVESFNGNGAA